MNHWFVLSQLVITVVVMVVAIAYVRIDPAIALVAGALYLGVVCGLGLEETTTAVATGFGDLMAEVGLIIGFGVLLGSVMAATGTLHRVVDLVLRLVGAKRSPYALGITCGTVFPSIYDDVMLVILAPMVRRLARESGRGIAPLAGALSIGLQAGLLIVIPGAAALAAAGALNLSLGVQLLWGIPFLVTGLVMAVFIHSRIVDRVWNRDKHELADQGYLLEQDGIAATGANGESIGSLYAPAERPTAAAKPGPGAMHQSEAEVSAPGSREFPLVIALLPVLVPLGMIMSRTICRAFGHETAVLGFIGNPIVALLTGLLLAIALALPTLGKGGVEKAVASGASTSGVILLFTAVAGSLGQVINLIGVGDMLAGLFSANSAVPVLLAWVVAALLRLAQGSASVALITATTLLAPIVGNLGIPAALIALAAAAGAMFGGHVTDNTFWMYQTLFGFTVRGTFVVYTGALATFSVIGLGFTMLLSLVT
ncbi:GntP family permease [Mycolicibacterium goodii]|uniref:GntP family permease n=1 Tax=Mycolicibacterium goodii TaxID=134601 RepID=UPI000C256A83|nr:SLC13 family permease [Mycolicibacterium goodii]PJK20415.1 gluconate permease [Mycolicibacterium goodii]